MPPLESFPAYFDLGAFTNRPPAPLPAKPTLLFVGMLERSKGMRRSPTPGQQSPSASPRRRLVVVGRGALADVVDRLRDDYPGRVEHVEELPPAGVSERMDESTCLVLPSRSEGLGRVILGVVRPRARRHRDRVGGIPDLVEDGENGLLVENGDVAALADALTRILTERGLADRLGAAALRVLAGVQSRPTTTRPGCAPWSTARWRKRGTDAPDLRDTQSVDAEDPILGATVAKLRALAERCDELVVITDRIGIARPARELHPADVRLADEARPRPPVHARARAAAAPTPAAGRGDRAHVPDLPRPRRAAGEARARAAGALVHALDDRPDAEARDRARGRRAQRRPPLVSDRGPEGARDRPRDRRGAVRRAERRAGRERDAAPARARADVAVERVRHAPARVCPRAGGRRQPDRRDPRCIDHRRGAAAPRASSRR